jgi:hypothetical protein
MFLNSIWPQRFAVFLDARVLTKNRISVIIDNSWQNHQKQPERNV